MPLKNLTFNGVRKPWLFLLAGRQKAPFAPLRRNILTVPGRPGAYLQSTDVEPIVIHQPIGFDAYDDEHALHLRDELAAWLITDEPVPLQFDDEPGRTYYAVVQNTIEDFTRFVNFRQGTIQFLCLDPYSYGPELTAAFPSDVVILTNNGTAPADPIFELEVKQPITFAMVATADDQYNMIGRPIDLETEVPFEEYELVLHDDMSTTAGWTNASSSDIDGAVAGSMTSNGTRFEPVSFGTGSGWHGPAMKRSVPQVLSDFRIEAIVGFWNANPAVVGRVEVYLLDPNGNAVCKMAMKDTRNSEALAWGESRLGDTTIGYQMINEYGDRPGVWNDFFGMLRIERRGNQWYAYIAKIDQATGEHYARRSVRWTDIDSVFTRNVAQVVVHFGQHGTHTTGAMGVYDVKIWKINNPQDHQVPYIARAGDVIVFDHANDDILLNGETIMSQKDFGGTFFKLKRGFNTITTLPEGAFDAKVKYRPRYR